MRMKTKRISPLKKHIGFWMRLVSNNVSQSFARKLDSSGVTVAEWVVLREMSECEKTMNEEPMAPSQVSELTGLTRGAVSKLIDRLVQKKLVSREASKTDRRFQDVILTNLARQLLPSLAGLADKNDDEYFSVLTKDERKTLLSLLIKTAEQNGLNKPPVE